MADRLRGIIWRIYLTALAVSSIAVLIFVCASAIDAYKTWRDRQTLIGYYETTFGKYDPEASINENTIDYSELDDLKGTKEPIGRLSDEQSKRINEYHKSQERECLDKMLKNGGTARLWCNGVEIGSVLKTMDFDVYTRVFPDFDLEISIRAILILFSLVVLRYWIAWMFTGKRPNSFP